MHSAHVALHHPKDANMCPAISRLCTMAPWVQPWLASMDPARMPLITITACARVENLDWQMSVSSIHSMCHSLQRSVTTCDKHRNM